MGDTKIKICGLTNTEDAELALNLGADYLGVIFAESPRQVDVSVARQIRDAVPDAVLIGVFQDAPMEYVALVVEQCDLNMIQLHGAEDPRYCRDLGSRTNIPIIKTFNAGNIPDTALLSSYRTTSFFLFDFDKTALSSTDLRDTMALMWEEVSRTRRQGFRVFLAGALDETNVRDAIEKTGAFCVDVCRGVECEPGRKDQDALTRFIAEVRS